MELKGESSIKIWTIRGIIQWNFNDHMINGKIIWNSINQMIKEIFLLDIKRWKEINLEEEPFSLIVSI